MDARSGISVKKSKGELKYDGGSRLSLAAAWHLNRLDGMPL